MKKYLAWICLLILFSGPAPAQNNHPVEIVDKLADLIEAHYILPEVATRVATGLRQHASTGRYSEFADDPKALADAISKDVINLSDDKHMYVEHVSTMDGGDDWIQDWLNNAPSKNYGVRKIEILDGNIGYLSLSSFYPLEISGPSIRAAMELLRHTQGLVLDLRNNGGGDETSANAIIASFLSEGSKSPLVIESRTTKTPLAIPVKLEWPRYDPQKKLVILINDRTFSAPESIAFSLQEIGRAIIVGSNSAGGAHMTDEATKISDGYQAGIPNKRPLGLLSGKNWEGTGVTPNIESSNETAIQLALEQF